MDDEHHSPGWTLFAICIATFMLLLDLRLFRNRSFNGVSIGAFGL